jgi:prepilin-type N-terminal cleavage/methylation domain-containing protein
VDKREHSYSRGFTLVELVVVIGILAILISLVLPVARNLMPRADEIVCMSRLRGLWLKFAPCATEPEGWPQVPKDIKIGSRQEQQWWIDYSSNALGVPEKLWHCPTIERASARAQKNDEVPLIHFLPTLFDSRPGTPNKWMSMPWFSEIGNIHGKGNLVIRSDGTVVPMAPVQ